jgi:hypothetical protein
MVDNSTNGNKTNNHLSPQTTEHKNTTAYGVGNPGLGYWNMSEWVIVVQRQLGYFSAIFQWNDDEVRFVLD